MYPNLRRIHVQAVVLMTADVHIVDRDGRDEDYVTYCNHKCPHLQSSNTTQSDDLKISARCYLQLAGNSGKASAKSTPPRYDWQVEEKLGGNDHYTEYRAKKMFMDGWTVRLRVYKIDPYQDTAEREAQRKLISNAFQAVFKIPHIQTFWVRDFFAADDGDCLVLVTDDIQGEHTTAYQEAKPAP